MPWIISGKRLCLCLLSSISNQVRRKIKDTFCKSCVQLKGERDKELREEMQMGNVAMILIFGNNEEGVNLSEEGKRRVVVCRMTLSTDQLFLTSRKRK